MKHAMPALLANALLASALLTIATTHAQADVSVKRGEYLSHIMDCGGCHNTGAFTPKPNLETPLSGSDIGFEIPGLGVFYPPNLTPDKKTGLGTWTDEQIIAAFTTGVRPDGRQLAPSMPCRRNRLTSSRDLSLQSPNLRLSTSSGVFGRCEPSPNSRPR